MSYVDGFIFAVPTDKVDAYFAIARRMGAIWKEYGAIDYVECLGDDVPYGELTSFPRAVQAKDNETVVFSWIVYESREARDAINEKVMADARVKADMDSFPPEIDMKRMVYGGFKTVVKL